MNHNVGTADRMVRITLGLLLLAVTAMYDSPQRWFGLLGLVPLLTGMVGNCPLYGLFGINTCATRK